jgi:hypothetical protein
MSMAKRVANNILRLEPLSQCCNKALFKKLVTRTSDGSIIAMKICYGTIVQRIEFIAFYHYNMFVGSALATLVAVFNNGVTLHLHHARKTQCLTGESAMTVDLSVLCVKNANKM